MNESPLDEFGNESQVEERYLRQKDCLDDKPVRENSTGKNSGSESFEITKNQWSIIGNDCYIPAGASSLKLPPGIYSPCYIGTNMVFLKKSINIDDLIEFPNSASTEILKEINEFWNKGEIFKHYGFLHRRGYLLYGPAGGGKTHLIHQVCNKIIEQDGVIFTTTNPKLLETGLEEFRKIEPDRKIVCIFEDIDAMISYNGETEILSLLDGENRVNKVLNIATTNYPERLPKRLVGRPRRFDRVIKIEMPNKDIRKIFFKVKLKLSDEEAEVWATSTSNFSFAALSELVISVKCLGKDFKESLDILRGLQNNLPSSEDDCRKMGFSATGEDDFS
jgi:hypothetical protein